MLLLDTRIEYLNATLTEINQKFGTTEFFFDSLGMDKNNCIILLKNLCE